MAHHHLQHGIETCHREYFDATLPPNLRAASGDTVTIDTVTGSPDVVPDPTAFHVPCITAIETALRGSFEFIVRDDLAFTYPRAETPTHHVTMGVDPDLDRCAVKAVRETIALIGETNGLSHADAYMLCSLAGDLHITQTVNGSKGVHMMMDKKHLRR